MRASSGGAIVGRFISAASVFPAKVGSSETPTSSAKLDRIKEKSIAGMAGGSRIGTATASGVIGTVADLGNETGETFG
jgi:hypothetical protein